MQEQFIGQAAHGPASKHPTLPLLFCWCNQGQRSFAYLAMKWNSWSCHELSGIEFGVEIEERGVR